MKRRRGNRTAIVCDLIVEYSGSEKVLDQLLTLYPDACLYSLFIVPAAEERIKKSFPQVRVVHSPFQFLVNNNKPNKYLSLAKIFTWLYWELLDLTNYRNVISSSQSFMSKNVKKGKDAWHLSYVHTPPRFLYGVESEMSVSRKFPIITKLLRWVDQRGIDRPDVMVANSVNVAKRIARYWGREAVVVYPPVDVSDKTMQSIEKNYYIFLGRLTKQKGAELAIKCCTKFNLPLVVVGDGDELNKLKMIAGKTIKFVTGCDEETKWKYLSGAKALLFTSINEDFGIVPVEAMLMGVPVIAYKSGGVTETVIEGKTGVFFEEHTVECMKKAIDKVKNIEIDESQRKILKRKFGTKAFTESISELMERKVNQPVN